MSAEAPTPAEPSRGSDGCSRDLSRGQGARRRPARRRGRTVAVCAAGAAAALAAVSGLAHVATGSGWKAEYAKVADEVTPGYELVHRSASGNALCFDVCREVSSRYLTQESAEVAIAKLAERMRGAGFTDVGYDCEANAWCSAWGDAGAVAVHASKYKGDSWAAKEPGVADQLTVTVGMPE